MTAARSATLPGPDARARLHDTFAALCRIESPTGHERACADWIVRELTALGLRVIEDGAATAAGAGAGNLLVRIPGAGPGWLLLCAHMDTVPLTAPVEPVLREGVWENANAGILGADNKAAVAALVELARELSQPGAAPPASGIELLFTVSEETGLNGAKAFDVASLASRVGFVFDQASPFGEIVAASPTHVGIVARIRGRAAHAGLAPQDGRSAIAAAARAIAAMPQGRLDADTTANVGVIAGGTAYNVVPALCTLEAEVRGVEQGRVDAVLTETIDALQEAADVAECDLDLEIQQKFAGYRVRPGEPGVELAGRALRSLGHEPRLVHSGVGTDANAFRAAGLQCISLANATEHPHEPGECVSADALETGLALAQALVREAAVGSA